MSDTLAGNVTGVDITTIHPHYMQVPYNASTLVQQQSIYYRDLKTMNVEPAELDEELLNKPVPKKEKEEESAPHCLTILL